MSLNKYYNSPMTKIKEQELDMANTKLNLNDVVEKSNIFCLYHIKVKKEILSLNP